MKTVATFNRPAVPTDATSTQPRLKVTPGSQGRHHNRVSRARYNDRPSDTLTFTLLISLFAVASVVAILTLIMILTDDRSDAVTAVALDAAPAIELEEPPPPEGNR